MRALRKKQQDDAPAFYGKLTDIAEAYWRIAQSAQAEVLRGTAVYATAVTLRVFPDETQRARIRRALEMMFQVQFVASELLWTGDRDVSGSIIFNITAPFECRLSMRRTIGTTVVNEVDADGFTFERQARITYEDFHLDTYSELGWEAYLELAEEHMRHINIRDVLVRAPDREAVLDMVCAILISASERPRSVAQFDNRIAGRAPRGIRIQD